MTELRVRLERRGSHGGIPVVLIHPLGMDGSFWDLLDQAFDGRDTVTFDLPGHGASPVPAAPYSVADVVSALHAALRDAQIPLVDIIGMSMGGTIAHGFAARYPDSVNRLVLADCVAQYPDTEQWRVRAAVARQDGVAVMIPTLLPIWFTAAEIERRSPAVSFVEERFNRMSAAGYALACEALGTVDDRALTDRITAPTLAVVGADDFPAVHAEAERFVVTLDAPLLILDPGGHAAILERPQEFSAAVRRFLGDASSVASQDESDVWKDAPKEVSR